jgi:hypothetical protein
MSGARSEAKSTSATSTATGRSDIVIIAEGGVYVSLAP